VLVDFTVLCVVNVQTAITVHVLTPKPETELALVTSDGKVSSVALANRPTMEQTVFKFLDWNILDQQRERTLVAPLSLLSETISLQTDFGNAESMVFW